ncbi:MAG: type I glyceraldehyde-3-phosphate dehydrogenase [Candidatus Pacebacteria bacterium]|nr:type I glyceraldehyde-3-phosphate dehydrogenase [Candidatus Paceibacterota bacterium]
MENNNKKIRVAINGLGRIGRAFFKLAQEENQIQIVAINDLTDLDNLVYLLKYDTSYGFWDADLKIKSKDILEINNQEIKFFNEPDPQYLPWKDLDIDIVIEATGIFNTYKKSSAHIKAGAKRIILTAPAKDEVSVADKNTDTIQAPNYSQLGKTVLMGVNDDELKTCQISANGSCTTNAVSPILHILNQKIGIEKAILNTIHSYTASQKIVDSANKKDFRRGRAGAQNIVPTTTGAAIATTLAIKELVGKFDGMAMRVPVILGSLIDLTFITKKNTNKEEINNILKEVSKDKVWEGIFSVTDELLVSSDIINKPYASLVDLSFTKVVDGNLVKVIAWYDNEMGYANTLIKHILKTL